MDKKDNKEIKEELIDKKENKINEIIYNILFLLLFIFIVVYWVYVLILKEPDIINKTKFEFIKVKDYNEISNKASEIIFKEIKKNPKVVLGLSAGLNNFGIYKKLIEKFEMKELNFEQVKVFSVDEYIGLDKKEKESHYSILYENFLNHVNIKESNINFPKTNRSTLKNNCKEYSKKLNENPIDILLIDIGINGEIGFNDLNTSFDSDVSVNNLSYYLKSQKSKFFNGNISKVPSKAITMGIKNILNAKKIIVTFNGVKDSNNLQRLFKNSIDINFPLSALLKHKGKVILIADEEACNLIRPNRKLGIYEKLNEKLKFGIKRGISYDFFEGTKRKDINIIFLPGGGNNRKIFIAFQEFLSDYNLYFIDFPGHGYSSNTGYSVSNYINSIIDFIEDMQNVFIAGHCFGGDITFGILAKNNPNVLGGIIGNTVLHFKFDKKLYDQMIRGTKELKIRPEKRIPPVMYEIWEKSREKIQIRIKDILFISDIDFSKFIKDIEVPVLVAEGISDKLITTEQLNKLKNNIKNLKLILYPEGHFSIFIRRKEFSLEIKNFINDILKKRNI